MGHSDLASATGEGQTRAAVAKTSTLVTRLLLPYFEVDTNSTSGRTTLFAIRNESTDPVDVTVRYFEANRPAVPQLEEVVTLGPKRVETTNIRLKNVIAGGDGIARGFVLIETALPVIQGDYFQLDDANNFAAGDRLVDADGSSMHNELCVNHSIRAFNGGGFDGGTTFTIFIDSPTPASIGTPVAFYTVYSEGGGDPIFSAPLFSDALAFRVKASELNQAGFQVPNFAAIEFELQNPGHVWAQMDALGRFSVGLDASCLDEAPQVDPL